MSTGIFPRDLQADFWENSPMEINRDNLLTLIQSGIKRDAMSVSGLERQAGVPKDTVRDFLRGKTQVLRADKLQKILSILEPQHKVRIAGYVSANAQIILYDGSPATKEEVDCPPGLEPADVVAIRIEGDGMLPVFHDGWIVYYSRNQDIPIPAISGGWQVPYPKADKANESSFAGLLGKPAIAGLTDGRILLGTLKASATGKSYDIINYNASDIHGVKLQWAAKIIFIKTE